MKLLALVLIFFLVFSPQTIDGDELLPTIKIVSLVRNKALVLPNFLALLENLDYPKNRISIWIRSDHNEDDTGKILSIWSQKWMRRQKLTPDDESVYHDIDVHIRDDISRQTDQIQGPFQWSHKRFQHVMNLREEGLQAARRSWADWVWQLDADVFLTNRMILKDLILGKNYTIVAPVLKSLGLYSNFWGGMSDSYYYERTEDYENILKRKKKFQGCHSVPMVHSCVLVNLRKRESLELTYKPENLIDYEGPYDDIITFAVSAHWNDVELYACNEDDYGYVMLPLDDSSAFKDDKITFSNLKLEIMAYDEPLPHTPELAKFVAAQPQKDSLGVDHVYMINLERRPDRRNKMSACLNELGIEYEWMRGVDGKKEIDQQYLQKNQIQMMPDFVEPYHNRASLTYGEIGCFMSHFNTWKDILKHGYSTAIVLEDDVRFEPNFREKMRQLHTEIKSLNLEWDLIFLGRKILTGYDEPWVENSNLLLHVNYTYWTLGYLISERGARILVSEEPLSKLVPVDEYLPIMYDRHPKESWKNHYKNRNLKAFSVHPLFLFPTFYTGEDGYISDTEDSRVMDVPCDKKSSSKDEL